jgi:outer membrane protein with beta-barrel domain
MRSIIVALFALASVLVMTQPAHATWGVGANMGLTIHNPEGPGDDVTMFGVPTQANLLSSIRPGLRVSYTGTAMSHEGFLDLSYDRQSSGGDHLSAFRLAGNYQYNFTTSGSPRPYMTFGVGMFHEGLSAGGGELGATAMTFGGGFGVGFPVSDKAGRIRVEARMDKLDSADDNGVTVIDEATVIQIGAGFDLWFR